MCVHAHMSSLDLGPVQQEYLLVEIPMNINTVAVYEVELQLGTLRVCADSTWKRVTLIGRGRLALQKRAQVPLVFCRRVGGSRALTRTGGVSPTGTMALW